jgi:hypothetical protein
VETSCSYAGDRVHAIDADVGGVPQPFVLDATEFGWRRGAVDGRWYRLTEASSWPEVERAAVLVTRAFRAAAPVA